MNFSCPGCGAKFTTNETCQDRFSLIQLKDIEQPGYYAAHHISVPCYLLQHNAYSRQGWLEVRQLLSRFVYDRWTPEMARRTLQIGADSQHRMWSFTRGAKLCGVDQIVRHYTIADIRLDTAEDYCADVRHWAERILEDSQQFTAVLGGSTSPWSSR